LLSTPGSLREASSVDKSVVSTRHARVRALQDNGTVRTYFHVDMDAFFVSVEELYDPSLKGKPVVVGGRPDERGVVSAASYAARKFGVHSAMPLRTAYKLCPQAIFVDGHPDRYREYSHKVHDVLTAFSPLVEMASIDEAYLDITGTERLYGPPLKAAHLLHQRMKAATNLNCSIGIAASRLREHKLQARTLQLKLRYSDFSTFTRAHSVPRGTDLDTEIFEQIRDLFRHNWKTGATIRLLGVHAAGWAEGSEQLDLLGED